MTNIIPIDQLEWNQEKNILVMKIDLAFCQGKKNVLTVKGTTRNITYKIGKLVEAPNDLSAEKAYWQYSPMIDRSEPLGKELRKLRLIVWKETPNA